MIRSWSSSIIRSWSRSRSRTRSRSMCDLGWHCTPPQSHQPAPAHRTCRCAGTVRVWGQEQSVVSSWSRSRGVGSRVGSRSRRTRRRTSSPPVTTSLYASAHDQPPHCEVVQLWHYGDGPAQSGVGVDQHVLEKENAILRTKWKSQIKKGWNYQIRQYFITKWLI